METNATSLPAIPAPARVPRPVLLLTSIVELLDSPGTGATFRELSGGKLKEVSVSVPLLAEQQRIVAKLDALAAETQRLARLYTQSRRRWRRDRRRGGTAFEETGGFSERLMTKRIEAREQSREKGREPSPACPQCKKPMRRRTSAKEEFWGCSAFPDCKGIRPV